MMRTAILTIKEQDKKGSLSEKECLIVKLSSKPVWHTSYKQQFDSINNEGSGGRS